MKAKLTLVLSFLCFFCSVSVANINIPKSTLSRINWQEVNLSQKVTTELSEKQIAPTQHFAGIESAVAAYKIPANQGTLKLTINSLVVDEKAIFIPNVLVLDANYNVSINYPSSQFKQLEARGLNGGLLQAELSLTPTAGQDFVYLLIYTTANDLKGETVFMHPAKLYAKAKGNQPPAIADLKIKHSNYGKIQLDVAGMQSTQFVGLNSGALIERKPIEPQSQTVGKIAAKESAKTTFNQPVENSTEKYFNQAVKDALKNNDVNKAMNLVNEAEQLGLTSPRKTFLQQVSAK